MKINLQTKSDLLTLIERSQEQYNDAKSEQERFAILNNIGHLYIGLNFMSNEKIDFSLKKEANGHKNKTRFLTNHNSLLRKWNTNFILNKKFHNVYIDKCLEVCEDIYDQKGNMSYGNEYFEENDYWEILFEFTKSLGQSQEFERYIRNGHIFNMTNGSKENFLGIMAFNPIDGQSSIFLDNFSYKLSDMIINAHEFGHCVDFGMIFDQGSKNSFHKYNYCSIYDEVLPRLYEKLLLSYLNKNGIKTDSVRNKFYDMIDIHHEYLLSVLLFTFLDDRYLKNENYKKLSDAKFYDLIKEYIPYSEGIDNFIKAGQLDLFVDISYAYGDIMASFLQDDINKYGEFNSPLMHDFLNERINFFDRDFIERNDLSPNQYQKIYQKELDIMKNN